MKTLSISDLVVFEDFDCDLIIKGASKEEVIEKTLQGYRENLESSSFKIEITPDIRLPEKAAARMPRVVPDGFSLVIFERCSHCDGWPYEWRFVAVPTGSTILDRNTIIDEYRNDRRIDKEIELISFVDSNSSYHYTLPQKSMEPDETSPLKGEWWPIKILSYDY